MSICRRGGLVRFLDIVAFLAHLFEDVGHWEVTDVLVPRVEEIEKHLFRTRDPRDPIPVRNDSNLGHSRGSASRAVGLHGIGGNGVPPFSVGRERFGDREGSAGFHELAPCDHGEPGGASCGEIGDIGG